MSALRVEGPAHFHHEAEVPEVRFHLKTDMGLVAGEFHGSQSGVDKTSDLIRGLDQTPNEGDSASPCVRSAARGIEARDKMNGRSARGLVKKKGGLEFFDAIE